MNVAPVARIAGPVGAVEAGAGFTQRGSDRPTRMATSSTCRCRRMANARWRDKAVVIFQRAGYLLKNTRYVVNLTVSDGTLSSTAVLYAE